MILRFAALVIVFQTFVAAQQNPQDFVLNSSNPYVYLKLDHVGPRKPAVNGEPAVGVWITVVNNCRIPILVPTIRTDQGVDGITVLDEIVKYSPGVAITANKIEPVQASGKDASDTIPNPTKVPEGYDRFSNDLPSFTRILPGASLLFSVPINHVVGNGWYMRVRFSLDIPNSKSGPYSYADSFTVHVPTQYLQGGQSAN